MLLTVIGLALGLLYVVLPMTQWRLPPFAAECLALLALGTILTSLAISLWGIRSQLSAPVSFVARVLVWPETRATMRYSSVLLVFLIIIEWIQVRPMYQDMQSIRTTLRRYVQPRHLTDAQIGTIANYLSHHEPQHVKMIQLKNREEAGSYRADIQRALMAGGWIIDSVDVSDDIPEGVSTNIRQAQQNPPDPKHPEANEILQEAFRLARVQVNQQSSGGGAIGFTITIGHRRMDDGDITYRKQALERLRKMTQEEQDDQNY
jgi:hypothetical protein